MTDCSLRITLPRQARITHIFSDEALQSPDESGQSIARAS
jgi:hypothetical protein